MSHTNNFCSNGRSVLRLNRDALQNNRVEPINVLTKNVQPVILMSCGNPIEFGSCVDVKVSMIVISSQ